MKNLALILLLLTFANCGKRITVTNVRGNPAEAIETPSPSLESSTDSSENSDVSATPTPTATPDLPAMTGIAVTPIAPIPVGGLMAFGTGRLGKYITNSPIECVKTRSLIWSPLPSANWRPLFENYGGKEIVYVPMGNKLDLETSGMIGIGPRSAVGLHLEVVAPNGYVLLRTDLATTGTTGSSGYSHTFSHSDVVYPVVPGVPLKLRVGMSTYTPDDEACPAITYAHASANEVDIRIEDYLLR